MLRNSPFFNVFLFSFFWALQIFFAKLGLMAGAKVLPFQIQSGVIALVILTLLNSSQLGIKLRTLFCEQRPLLWKLLSANAIHFGVGGFLSLLGISLTAVINAGFLVKMTVATTTLLAWFLLKERMSIIKAVMMGMMLAGAYLLSTNGVLMIPRIGDLLLLGACLAWSYGNVIVRRELGRYDISPDIVSLLRPLAGLPILFLPVILCSLHPFLLARMEPILGYQVFDFSAYSFYALAVGFFTAMSWIYLNRTLKIATASYMTMMSMLTPVIVTLLAVGFLKEGMGPVQILGAALIITSGIVVYASDISQE
jgi:drug/metabolite transporter (DMT)-like permease